MSTIPFNFERCKKRLLEEYKTYGNLIIAFDFDNTVFDYKGLGDDYSDIIQLLKTCKDKNMTLVLFTVCTNPNELQKKIDYLYECGIKPDYINTSPIFEGSTKPYYNLLLDDRAGLEEAVQLLQFILQYEQN
jgi:hypothetical protein